jgi:hypothetical protein
MLAEFMNRNRNSCRIYTSVAILSSTFAERGYIEYLQMAAPLRVYCFLFFGATAPI